MTIEFFMENLPSSRLRGVQRPCLYALAIFQVSSAQNNTMPKKKILLWHNLPPFSMSKRVHGMACYKDFPNISISDHQLNHTHTDTHIYTHTHIKAVMS